MIKQDETARENWAQKFEELYILTYRDVYRHISLLTDHDRQAAKKLLIQTYTEAYRRNIHLPSVDKQIVWLNKVADSLAESDFGYSKEDVESAYSEVKVPETDYEEPWMEIDETSVYLEIEDRVSLLDTKGEPTSKKTYVLATVQSIFSGVLLVVAVTMLLIGVFKVKEQLDVMREPFVRPLTFDGDSTEEGLNPPKDQVKIKIGGKAVMLSDIGQVLYSLPLEEAGMENELTENPEIQKQAGWTYYLPCPNRKDSQLGDVAPSLSYTLYRIGSNGDELEIIAREVDDYTFWEDNIYVSQFGRIQRIDMHDTFEKAIPGIYAEIKDDELYLYDTLGKALKTDTDGSIHYEDRVFKMSSNRVEDVIPAPHTKDHITYYMKETGERSPDKIYRSVNGKEEVFITQEQTIDSFCIAGDWLYYSAYIRRGKSGAHYSEIYRKSLAEEKKPELVREEFTGRILQMYFSEEQNQIYANYIPKNWKNNRGVIAAITMSGQMSYLDDTELRSGQQTTGNDMLEFIMVKEDQVYCYWKDCHWKPGETPVAIWRKAVVIPDDNRIRIED